MGQKRIAVSGFRIKHNETSYVWKRNVDEKISSSIFITKQVTIQLPANLQLVRLETVLLAN